MISGSGGKAPRVVSSRAVALYRPDDGRVVHLHTVRVFEGGREVGQKEAEQKARSSAEKVGHDLSKLRVLHLEEPPTEPGPYQVDAASGALTSAASRRRG